MVKGTSARSHAGPRHSERLNHKMWAPGTSWEPAPESAAPGHVHGSPTIEAFFLRQEPPGRGCRKQGGALSEPCPLAMCPGASLTESSLRVCVGARGLSLSMKLHHQARPRAASAHTAGL